MYLVSRTETFAKLFFIVSFTGLFMYVALAFYSLHTAYSTVSQMPGYQDRFGKRRDSPIERVTRDLKYILVWAVRNKNDIQDGQGLLIDNECSDVNCYITSNKSLMNGDYANFDAIIFNMSVIRKWLIPLLPKQRSPHQKYVFYAKIPSSDNPICNVIVNNYFNWTWTYKFGSDIFSPFIEVKEYDGTVVAPRTDVTWAKYVQPSTKVVDNIDEVNTKTKAVAWIMNECRKKNKNLISITKLQKALKEHSLVLDIFGCGNLECPEGGCLAAIERDYYFYLVYEYSVAEDYVSHEVLKAYHYDAVPIVAGGADYSKFLPDKSYIDFQGMSEEKLAALIAHTIRNPSRYREYFNWKKLYTVVKMNENQGYCDLCTLLNDKKKFERYSTYENFRKWWYNGSLKEKCLPKGAETYMEVMSYNKAPSKKY